MLQRFNAFIEKRMAFVTPICMILGILFPDIAEKGIPFVPLVFAFMTFTGSMKATFRDIKNVILSPLPLFIMLLVLHIGVPGLARLMGSLFFANNPHLITGMVLEFSVPAAVVGLIWVTIYDGNVSLSLSLLVLDTILSPFLIPVFLKLFVGTQVKMDALGMMIELLWMIAIPAMIAMCLNHFVAPPVRKNWPKQLAPWSKISLMFVIFSNGSRVAPYVRNMNWQRFGCAVAILVLAASGYAIGWVIAILLRLKRKDTIAVIFGSGMRNISAGAVIAAAYFPGEVMFPVMIGTLFQQILAACYGSLIGKIYPSSTD